MLWAGRAFLSGRNTETHNEQCAGGFPGKANSSDTYFKQKNETHLNLRLQIEMRRQV